MQEPELNEIHRTGNPQIDVLAAEVERARSAASEAASRAERTNAGVLRLESEIERNGRRTLGSMVALLLMAAVVGACAWWANSVLNDHGLSLAKLPALSESVDSLGKRLASAEDSLSRLPDDWNDLTSRMTSLEKKVNSGFQTTQRQALEMAAQTDQKAQASVDRQTSPLRDQIAQLETQRESDAARIASLDNELRSIQRDVSQQIAAVRGAIPADVRPQLANIRSEMARNSSDIHSIANQVDRDVVTFEVAANRSTQLTPGVYLNVGKTDVDRQQINGWLYLVTEHRTLWLHNEGLLKPITVYGTEDKRPREVILTRVNRNQAVGYVLVPKSNPVASSASNN